MGRGGRGRSVGFGRGVGFGPNLSWSCRWFPGLPRRWWAMPYGYRSGTPYGPSIPYGYRYPYF